MSNLKGQEKWSSVRIADSKNNSLKIENHVSIHSNLSLNGLEQKQGKEVTVENNTSMHFKCYDFFLPVHKIYRWRCFFK